MDRATVNIDNDIVSVEFIRVYHFFLLFINEITRRYNKTAGSGCENRRLLFSRLAEIPLFFAALICYAAGSLAGRLAGGLAFSATAVCGVHITCTQCLYSASVSFAVLIRHAAGSLAGRLAGGLALTATAVFCAFTK